MIKDTPAKPRKHEKEEHRHDLDKADIESEGEGEGEAEDEDDGMIGVDQYRDDEVTNSDLGDALDYDGYTSSDSFSGDILTENDWQLHQVRTRSYETHPGVIQYWHWVKDNNQQMVIEHQVLGEVRPVKWSVFKKPYNFHLTLADVEEVLYAPGCKKVVVIHKTGKDGCDVGPRGNVMAEFRRNRTKRRFLTILVTEMGVKVVVRSV